MHLTRKMIRITGMLGMLALASCSPDHPRSPVIQTETVSHAIVFEGGKTQIAHAEFSALSDFVQSVPAAAVTYVGIAAEDGDAREMDRVARIKAYLTKQGIDPKTMHLQPASQDDGRTVELTLQYAKALPLPNCPDWSDNAWFEHTNAMNFSNFGCAYYDDLTVQMQNPADYNNASSAPAVSDAARDSVSIQKYRTGAIAPMATVSASSPSTSSSAPTTGSTSVSSTGTVGSQ